VNDDRLTSLVITVARTTDAVRNRRISVSSIIELMTASVGDITTVIGYRTTSSLAVASPS
jgi:hypothetical protein